MSRGNSGLTSERTIYLEEGNEIFIHCPKCGNGRRVDVSKFLDKNGPIRLRYRFKCPNCDCGHKRCEDCENGKCSNNHTAVITIERRKHFRKSVDLDGYIQLPSNTSIPVRIIDLSRTGLKMQPQVSASVRQRLPETLTVHFNLDDVKKTAIVKKCQVRRDTPGGLECLFEESESFDPYDKAIGFYLMRGG